MLRRKIHQLIDQYSDEKLPELLAVLEDYKKYDTYIPRMNRLPVYDMGNPIHGKIMLERYGRPILSVVKNNS